MLRVENAPARATRREWIGLAVLALPTLLLSIDVSVLYLALPHISTDLDATATQQLWILDIYSFLLAGFLVTMGTVGDRIGRRRLLLIGGAAFGVASVLAAYSTSAEMLIATRALLGVAGATLMPSTMALIRNMFVDPTQMGTAISVWFACFLGGMTLGPLVGGVLLEQFWWGSAFLLGVPFMVVLLVAGPALLPEYKDPEPGRLDPVSVLLSLGAILPLIYGLKSLARDGLSPVSLTTIVVGLYVGVVFVRRQGRLTHPLLDLRLFANRVFSTSLGVMLLTGVVMAGISLMATIYLQVVEGLSPLQAGLWLIPQNVAMISTTMLGPVVGRRFRTSYVLAAGLLVAAVGLAVLTRVDGTGGLAPLVVGMSIAAFGIGLPMPLLMGLMLGSVPVENAGSASALSETSGEFGIAMGIASLGSFGAYVYRSALTDLLPGDLPSGVAAAARESVGAAVSTAQQMPGRLGTELVASADSAFASGLNAVAVVGAVVFAVLAVVATRLRTDEGSPTDVPDDALDAVLDDVAQPALAAERSA
ncbi:MAG: MFS transporter [Nocardioidaceae bacterium]